MPPACPSPPTISRLLAMLRRAIRLAFANASATFFPVAERVIDGGVLGHVVAGRAARRAQASRGSTTAGSASMLTSTASRRLALSLSRFPRRRARWDRRRDRTLSRAKGGAIGAQGRSVDALQREGAFLRVVAPRSAARWRSRRRRASPSPLSCQCRGCGHYA